MPFLFGLALPLVYCPVFIRPSTDPKLIVLSIVVPLIFLGRTIKWTEVHQVGALFLLWCTVSLLWAMSLNDGLLRLWGFLLAGGTFAIVSTLTERQVERFFLGVIMALAVNALMAGVQFGGWDGALYEALALKPIIKVATWAAGVQVNGNYLAEIGLMGVALSIGLRRWWWALAVSPCVLLSGSKGGLVAGSLILCVVLWRKSRLLALAFPLVVILGGAWHVNKIGVDHPSLETRLPMYLNSLAATTWTGHGIGSFWSIYPLIHDKVIESPPAVFSFEKRPRTAHNDTLTLLVEVGVVGFVIALWGMILLFQRRASTTIERASRLGILSFLLLGVFNFPLYVPTTAVLAAACAGALCRDS